jgi:hypothetical protein
MKYCIIIVIAVTVLIVVTLFCYIFNIWLILFCCLFYEYSDRNNFAIVCNCILVVPSYIEPTLQSL